MSAKRAPHSNTLPLARAFTPVFDGLWRGRRPSLRRAIVHPNRAVTYGMIRSEACL